MKSFLLTTVSLLIFSISQVNAQITPPNDQGVILPNAKLFTNNRIYSSNGQYFLVPQGDGNLCLYKVGSNQALWTSGTVKSYPCDWALFDNYMDIKLFGGGGQYWTMNKGAQGRVPQNGTTYFYWILQSDGNFVCYYNLPEVGRGSLSTNTDGGRRSPNNHEVR